VAEPEPEDPAQANAAPDEDRLAAALTALARRDEAMASHGRRWDAYAAIIATFVGLLALGVSAYTAYVQRQQLRAQVWPYVMLTYTNVDDGMAFSIVNQGIGPAQITQRKVAIHGTPIESWSDLGGVAGFVHEQGESTINAGFKVLPAGKQIDFLRPADNAQSRAQFKQLFVGGEHALAMSICYCSVLGECWITSIGEDPPPIETCPRELALSRPPG
jgi:hypothetical protein